MVAREPHQFGGNRGRERDGRTPRNRHGRDLYRPDRDRRRDRGAGRRQDSVDAVSPRRRDHERYRPEWDRARRSRSDQHRHHRGDERAAATERGHGDLRHHRGLRGHAAHPAHEPQAPLLAEVDQAPAAGRAAQLPRGRGAARFPRPDAHPAHRGSAGGSRRPHRDDAWPTTHGATSPSPSASSSPTSTRPTSCVCASSWKRVSPACRSPSRIRSLPSGGSTSGAAPSSRTAMCGRSCSATSRRPSPRLASRVCTPPGH